MLRVFVITKTIAFDGTTIGTITWDQDTGLFDFECQVPEELLTLLSSTRINGGLTYLSGLSDREGIEISARTMAITHPKFLDQLTLAINNLGYDLS
jgi:hypothetical protein